MEKTKKKGAWQGSPLGSSVSQDYHSRCINFHYVFILYFFLLYIPSYTFHSDILCCPVLKIVILEQLPLHCIKKKKIVLGTWLLDCFLTYFSITLPFMDLQMELVTKEQSEE